MSGRTAIIGSGLIGRAWAIAFARSGWEVRLWDPAEEAAVRAREIIAELLADLTNNEMLGGHAPEAVLNRITSAPSLAAAMEGANWVQENAPGWRSRRRSGRRWNPGAPIGHSGQLHVCHRAVTLHRRAEKPRALLYAHPINPPYLVPAVELVPAPWTSQETMQRAEAVMRQIGQAPIMMRKEIDGFVMNRLQGALLEEAFRLVADGVCGVEDVDVGLREGLALRWSFMGPFETIDLNAPGGVRDYAERYQGLYEGLFASMQRRVDWCGPVMDESGGRRSQWRQKTSPSASAGATGDHGPPAAQGKGPAGDRLEQIPRGRSFVFQIRSASVGGQIAPR